MKNLKFYILVFVSIIISGASFAQVGSMELDDIIPVDSEVIIGTLDNGMKYYIRSNEEPKNRVELTLVVRAGAIDEDEDQRGLAHFCEHMAFNGTKNFEKHEIIKYLESLGMKFGPEVNAYTSFDETVYGITVPLDSVEYLDKGLLVLHDWASEITFEDDEIDKERGVIHEEWRGGQGAQDRMMKKYLPVMLNNSRYAERLPIGLMDVVDNCDYEVLRRFYQDWYRPDLMAIIAVGDFDEKSLEKKVKDLFSQIPSRNEKRPKKEYGVPDHDETLVSVATDPEAQRTMIQLYYKHPTAITKTVKDYRQNIIHNLFNGMISSRLQELTLTDNPPFLFGYSGYGGFIGPKDAYTSVAMTSTEQIESALTALVTENERVKSFGFTGTELEREKKSSLRRMEKSYNERSKIKSSSYVGEYKRNFLRTKEPIPGITYEYELYKKYIPGITLEEINSLAANWITENNRVLVLLAPEKEGVELPNEDDLLQMFNTIDTKNLEPYFDKVSDKPLVSQIPTPVKVSKKSKNKDLEYETWTMKNGAKIVVKKTDFKEDEILFTAFSLGGYSQYTQDDDISASITTSVMGESGIGDFDKIELDKYLSDKIVRLNPYIGELTEGFNGNTTPEDLETFMQLLYLNFTKPRRDKVAFNSYINRMKGVYENSSASPESVFRDEIKVVTSSEHQRRRPMTADLLDEANSNRVNYIFRQRFSDPGNFIFYFVGNIDTKVLKPLVEKYIGGLPIVKREETWKDLKINKPNGVVKKVVYKGSEPKGTVYMNFHGDLEYSWKAKADISVMSAILTTRLLESVREDESGVYSIGAYPSTDHYPKGEYGVTIYFGCDPERMDYLIDVVFAEIEKLKKEGAKLEDINKAKEKKLRERETNLRENRFWMRSLKNFDYHGSDVSDFSSYNDYINGMTQDGIRKMFNTYMDNENYIEVVLKPESADPANK